MIDRLSIRQRLWANLGLFILMFAVTFGLSYLMTQTTQQQSSQLAHKEQTQTAEITRFQERLMNTIQAMNHYLFALSNEQNKVFNERVDRKIDALSNRLKALGAEIENRISRSQLMAAKMMAAQQNAALETKAQDFQLPEALNDDSYRQTFLKALPASN